MTPIQIYRECLESLHEDLSKNFIKRSEDYEVIKNRIGKALLDGGKCVKVGHKPLINRQIIKFIEDIQFGCGMLSNSERRYTNNMAENLESKKLIVNGNVGPGSQVTIDWDIDGLKLTDKGYIFTLPGWDSGDIFMSGIVHIPKPEGCEKSECDPEWTHLDRLLENEYVKKIAIVEGQK